MAGGISAPTIAAVQIPGSTYTYTLNVAIPAGSTVLVASFDVGLGVTLKINGIAMTILQQDASAPTVWYMSPVAAAATSIALTSSSPSADATGIVAAVYTGVIGIGNSSKQHFNVVAAGGSGSTPVTTSGANSWVAAFWVEADGAGADTANLSGSPATITQRVNQGPGVNTIPVGQGDTNGPIASSGTTETITLTIGATALGANFVVFAVELLADAALSATATDTPTAGSSPLTVTFTSTPSGGTAPYTYAWTFGDGNTSTAQNPSHIYTIAGTHTPALTVTDTYAEPANATGLAPVIVTAPSNNTGGTLGNNIVGHHRAPKISTNDRIETSDNYGGN